MSIKAKDKIENRLPDSVRLILTKLIQLERDIDTTGEEHLIINIIKQAIYDCFFKNERNDFIQDCNYILNCADFRLLCSMVEGLDADYIIDTIRADLINKISLEQEKKNKEKVYQITDILPERVFRKQDITFLFEFIKNELTKTSEIKIHIKGLKSLRNNALYFGELFAMLLKEYGLESFSKRINIIMSTDLYKFLALEKQKYLLNNKDNYKRAYSSKERKTIKNNIK